MVTKRIIVIPLLIWLALMSVTTFFRYEKIVREKDSIAFIPYHYGRPEVRRIMRCPLERVNTIRMCMEPGPLFWCLTYTLNGKNYLLLDFGHGCLGRPGNHVGGWSIHDYDPLIGKIKALASKNEGDGFYWGQSLTLEGFMTNAFIFLFMAGLSAIVVSRT